MHWLSAQESNFFHDFSFFSTFPKKVDNFDDSPLILGNKLCKKQWFWATSQNFESCSNKLKLSQNSTTPLLSCHLGGKRLLFPPQNPGFGKRSVYRGGKLAPHMRGKFRDFPSIILPIFLAFPPNFGGNDFFKISPSYEVDFPPNRLFWAKFPPNFGGEQNRFPPRIMKIENVGGETCSPPFWGEKGGGEILEVAGNFFFCSPQKTGGNAYYG